MKRLIKIGFLIYLGSRLEHFSRKVLVAQGFAYVDKDGSLRRTDNRDERVHEVATSIVEKITGTKS
jgi:hypothetical protein